MLYFRIFNFYLPDSTKKNLQARGKEFSKFQTYVFFKKIFLQGHLINLFTKVDVLYWKSLFYTCIKHVYTLLRRQTVTCFVYVLIHTTGALWFRLN